MNEVKNTIHAATGGVTHETTNVTREQLVKVSDAAEAAFTQLRDSVMAAEKAILERAVADCADVKVYVNNYEDFEVAIPDEKNGPRWHHISLYYEKDGWRKEDPRRLKISVPGYGRFGTDKTIMVHLMTVAGRLAERLADIEKELALIDWATFDDANAAYDTALNALNKFDIEAEEAKKRAAKEDAAKRLAAGVVIQTAAGRSYSRNYIRVEKVTAKLVYWKGVDHAGNLEYGTYQSKKDEVLSKLANDAWKIVDDVKVVA